MSPKLNPYRHLLANVPADASADFHAEVREVAEAFDRLEPKLQTTVRRRCLRKFGLTTSEFVATFPLDGAADAAA